MNPFAIALAVLALNAGAPPATAAPRFPEPAKPCPGNRFSGRPWLGLSDFDLIKSGPLFRDCEFRTWARMGIGVERETFYWSGIELSPRDYHFGDYDRAVGFAARHGLRVLPVLITTPPFYSSAPAGTPPGAAGFYPPRNPDDMARFAAALVRRYGTRGTFWKIYPQLPRVPIVDWQVYNEPNYPLYWGGHPDAAAFTRLFIPVARAIRRADPRARVMTPGMPFLTGGGIRPERFVREMLRRGAGRWIDTFAINPYARTPAETLAFVRSFRRTLDRVGARRKSIWVTEEGFASAGPGHAPGRLGQGRYIDHLLTSLERKRRTWRIGGVIQFEWRDRPTYGGQDGWAFHLGLRDSNDRRKPALSQFERTARRIDAQINARSRRH